MRDVEAGAGWRRSSEDHPLPTGTFSAAASSLRQCHRRPRPPVSHFTVPLPMRFSTRQYYTGPAAKRVPPTLLPPSAPPARPPLCLRVVCRGRGMEATLAMRRGELHAHRAMLMRAWVEAKARGAGGPGAPAAAAPATGTPVAYIL